MVFPRFSVFMICLAISLCSQGQIVTYPPAENITPDSPNCYPSTFYKVELMQGDKQKEDFVYCMNATHTTNNSKTTSWANFSFEGSITVRVTKLDKPVNYSKVLPRSAGIETHQIDEHIIEFELQKPGHFSVEFEDSLLIEHPLLIFANPIEKDIPAKGQKDIIWFEAGFHEIGDRFKIPSGKTVYLEGGAYVKGQFHAEDVSDIVVKGRGILSGEDYKPRTHNHMITMRNATDIEIEGITMIHSPRYMIALNGTRHHMHNIKMMGWWFSTDGISAGTHSLIENCFFKVNDDAVKLYKDYTTVRNCTIWQLENGAPFMISWNGQKDFGNCHVSDIDIIRVEHHWDNENLAVVCAVHGGKADISDFIIENVRIDNSRWRMFHLVTRPNRWGKWDPEEGSLSNMTFKNFEFYGEQEIPNLIMGHDQKHLVSNITFSKIKVNGKELPHLDRNYFIVDDETTRGVEIR